jgi:hypothetical protein
MPINPTHVPALTTLLSAERLANLTTLTGSAEAAIDLHQETLKLGAALMNVTATIEIALRNTVSENLSHYFGVPNWLQQPPVDFQWKAIERSKITMAVDSAKRAEYSKLSQARKAALDALAYPSGRPPNTSHMRRAKDRRRHLVVTEGKVIAELTLYFWKRLYGPDYDQSLWRTTLKRTFPDKTLSRAAVATQLEHFYQARNRLAHHEPVLYRRFADTISAIEFVTQRLGAANPSPDTPLATLLADEIEAIRGSEAALRRRLDAYRV